MWTKPLAPKPLASIRNLPAKMLLLVIRVWQLGFSSWLPPRCRFQPTCSAYGIEAIRRHGAMKGGYLTLKRLLRCHPLGGNGYDPVPPLS